MLGQSQATALTGVYYPRGRFPYRQRVLIERNLYIGAKESDDAALAHRIVAEFSPPLFDITVTQFVAAPRAILYDHISDITHMGELSPENVRTRWLQKGHRFVGTNRIGAFYRWTMRGTIDEASPGEAFGFLTDSPSETHWRYTFTDAPGGTLVTETMRKHTPQIRPVVILQDMSGARDRRQNLREGMTSTLEALKRRFETPTPRQTTEPHP
ncbi:SRPBCC family protein [Tsukamurella soli]|uniref:SRPBCC family protein n=1 Tax=Tsukamurella soli TaxID=644556 RepID=UPI0031E5C6FC